MSDYQIEIQQTGAPMGGEWWKATIRQDGKVLAEYGHITERGVKREVSLFVRRVKSIAKRKHYFYTIKGENK